MAELNLSTPKDPAPGPDFLISREDWYYGITHSSGSSFTDAAAKKFSALNEAIIPAENSDTAKPEYTNCTAGPSFTEEQSAVKQEKMARDAVEHGGNFVVAEAEQSLMAITPLYSYMI